MTDTQIDVSPFINWIPEKIRNEIVLFATTVAVLIQQVGSYVVLKGTAAHVESWVLSAVMFVLAVVARGAVTPTHKVVVDVRDTDNPVNAGTSGPVEPGEIPPDLQ